MAEEHSPSSHSSHSEPNHIVDQRWSGNIHLPSPLFQGWELDASCGARVDATDTVRYRSSILEIFFNNQLNPLKGSTSMSFGGGLRFALLLCGVYTALNGVSIKIHGAEKET